MDKESKPRFWTVNFERRKHPRLSVDMAVEYWRISESQRYSGRLVNMGEGGLQLYIWEETEIGQNLGLTIFYSGLKLNCIEAQVQVVWKDFLFAKGEYFQIGIRFVNISTEDMDKIKNLLGFLRDINSPSEISVPSGVTHYLQTFH